MNMFHSSFCRDVRKAVIRSLQISARTIAIFVERTRDEAPEVRAEVYATLTDAPPVLLSGQLVMLLENGMSDREPRVVKSCQKLILKYVGVKSLLPFLHSLAPQHNQLLVEKIILFLVSQSSFNLNQIQYNPEHAVEYNILRRVCVQRAFDDEVSSVEEVGEDEILPTVPIPPECRHSRTSIGRVPNTMNTYQK